MSQRFKNSGSLRFVNSVTKRYELVRRWVAIGDTTDEGSQEWMATIDKAEKDLTTAVGRQLVPAVPIFLLTLLQSAEAKRAQLTYKTVHSATTTII